MNATHLPIPLHHGQVPTRLSHFDLPPSIHHDNQQHPTTILELPEIVASYNSLAYAIRVSTHHRSLSLQYLLPLHHYLLYQIQLTYPIPNDVF